MLRLYRQHDQAIEEWKDTFREIERVPRACMEK
jgi:hypothetical protein